MKNDIRRWVDNSRIKKLEGQERPIMALVGFTLTFLILLSQAVSKKDDESMVDFTSLKRSRLKTCYGLFLNKAGTRPTMCP